jgi:O-antigen ligase
MATRSHVATQLPVGYGARLRWFLAAEVLCVSGFLIFVAAGKMGLALLFLAGPLQVLAWLVALRDGYHALVLFAALLPLAGMELLPYQYWRYVYYPLTVLLLFLVSRTGFVTGMPSMATPLERHDRVALALLGVALVLSTVSAVAHGWVNQNLWVHVVMLAESLALLYFFATLPRTIREVRVLCLVVGIMLLIVTVPSMLILPSASGEGGLLGGKIIATPFGEVNLNVYGSFLCSGAALLLGTGLQTQRPGARLAVLMSAVALVGFLVLTKSRGAWFGFGVATLYLLLRTRSVRLWVAASAAVVLVASLGQLREVLLVRAAETSLRDPSFLGRLLLWFYVWKVGSANWLLGVGFDNFRYVKHFYGYPFPLSFAERYHAHNIFMEMFVDLGVFGFVGFCWIYLRTILRLDRIAKTRSHDNWGLALGLGAALVAFGAHGLFDYVVFQHGALALLAVLLGLGVSVSRLSRAAAADPTPRES